MGDSGVGAQESRKGGGVPVAVGLIAVVVAAAGALALLGGERGDDFVPADAPPPRERASLEPIELEVADATSPAEQAPEQLEPAEDAPADSESALTLPGMAAPDPVDPDAPANRDTGVRGRIVDALGRPIEGAAVSLRGFKPDGAVMMTVVNGQLERQGGTRSRATQSDERGEFEIKGLDVGYRYELTVEPGQPEFLGAKQSSPVLKQGEVVDAGAITLARAGVLEGVVYDPEGRPQPGAKVYLDGADSPLGRLLAQAGGGADEEAEAEEESAERPRRRTVTTTMSFSGLGGGAPVIAGPAGILGGLGDGQSTRTDAAGRFRFERVGPGPHSLRADLEGLESAQLETANVVEGRTTRVELQLGAALALRLKLEDPSGQPVPEAQVASIDGLVAGESDALGEVVLEKLAERRLDLMVTAQGFAVEQVTVDVPDPPGEVRKIVLTPGSVIRGRLIGSDGQPVGRGVVFLQPLETGPGGSGASFSFQVGSGQGQVDEEGRFELDPARPGRYKLRSAGTGAVELRKEFEVPEGGGEVDLGDLILGALSSVVATVLDSSGSPVQGAQVRQESGMVTMLSGPGGLRGGPVTDAQGRITVEGVEPGRRRFRAEASGFAVGVSDPVEVPEGGGQVAVTIRLTKGGRVEGRVLTSSGQPQPGARVTLVPQGGGSGSRFAQADAEGRYAFEQVAPGRYSLLLAFGTRQAEPVQVDVGSDQTVTRDLQVDPAAVLEGTVRDADGLAVAGCKLELGFLARGAGMLGSGGDDPRVVSARATTTTDAAGRYRFEGVSIGDQGVTVTDPQGRRFTYPVRQSQAGPTSLDLSLPRAGSVTIAGQVQTGGVAQGGLPLRLESLEGGALISRAATTDAKGRYQIERVPPGKYRVSSQGEDVGQVELTVTATEGTVQAPVLQLQPGVTLTVELRASDGGTSGEGFVSLQREGEERQFSGQAELGSSLTFKGVPPGETWQLVVFAEGYAAAPQQITSRATPGEQRVTVTLQPSQ